MNILVLFSLLYGLLAENIYITAPGPGINWNPGANVAVRWFLNGDNTVQNVDIDIMNGDANNASLVRSIAKGIPAKYGEFNWIVPAGFEKRQDYFIRMSSIGSKGAFYYYSGRFAVDGPVLAATAVKNPWDNPQLAQQQVAQQPANNEPVHANNWAAASQAADPQKKPEFAAAATTSTTTIATTVATVISTSNGHNVTSSIMTSIQVPATSSMSSDSAFLGFMVPMVLLAALL